MRKSSYCSKVTDIEMITNKNYWDDNDFISMNVSIVTSGVFFNLNDYQYHFNFNDKVKYLTLNEDGTYNLNIRLKDLWEIDLNKISLENLGHYYINEIYNLPVTKETTSISFREQIKLKSVNAKNWDTSQVTNMEYMFSECSGLTSLDLSSFDTSNVTDMRYMFYKCSGLTSLNLSNWDLSNIGYTYTTGYSYPNTNDMFYFCNNLTSLDLSNWVFSDTYILHNMFYNTSSKLKTIKVSGWNTTNLNKLIYEIKEYYTDVVLEGDIINIG
jgi:surface protein